MGKGKFWPPGRDMTYIVLKAPLNSNQPTNQPTKTPERISMKLGIYNHVVGMTTHANPCGAVTTWVVWANTWKKQFCFLRYTFLLLYTSARAEPAPVDRFWRSIRHTTCFRPRMCLLGSCSYCSHFGGKIPQKPPILGHEPAFSSLTCKI